MSTLAAEMPRKKTDKIVQAALAPEEYKEFHAHALEKQWSDKKLNENIIRWYLEEIKKKKKKA